MNLKVGDILIAKQDCKMIPSNEIALIIGKEYEIINIDQENEAIFIKSEIGDLHRFSAKQDQKVNNVDYYFDIKGKEKSLTDQEIKDYLKELIINQNDICKAVNKLSRKVKKLSKPNCDLNNIFGDPVGELDKIMPNKPSLYDLMYIKPYLEKYIKMYSSLNQAGDKVVNETPLTDLNNEVQLEKQAKELVKQIEQFTNGWNIVPSIYSEYNKVWKFVSKMKQIQATKASIEAINFILDNDFSRSELEGIKGVLNGMA